jgi:hypothetical protein
MLGVLQLRRANTSDPVTRKVFTPKFLQFIWSTRKREQLVKVRPFRPVVFWPSIVPPEMLKKVQLVEVKAAMFGFNLIVPSITTHVLENRVRGVSPMIVGAVR